MKIAIIGAGNVGRTLGAKWAQAGHEIVFGVRDPQSPKTRRNRAAAGGSTKVDSIAGALAFGEIVLLAVPGSAVESIIMAHASALNRKIILDATNNVRAAEMSAVPILTTRTPQAQVMRAFNTLGWENFAQPVMSGLQADLFYCGLDDATARRAAEQLITDIGLRPVYVGGLDQVAVLDNLTRLWFVLSQKMGRHLAFKLLVP